MAAPTLLWYVHHHGYGHWRRALAVSRTLRTKVVFASSLAPPWELPPNTEFIELAHDAPADDTDVDAAGHLHWAPRLHSGLLTRHRTLLSAARHVIGAVVDVSVEVTMLLRLSGIPVVAVRLPGRRVDRAHRTAFALADRVVMPVPAAWSPSPATGVGLVSDLVVAKARKRSRHILLIRGAGGGGLDSVSVAALRKSASIPVVEASGTGELGDLLASADVVVGNTGLGTVADVAVSQRPFITIPAPRPFDEQLATARLLRRHRLATVADTAPGTPEDWEQLIRKAHARGPLVADTGGDRRLAALLDTLW